MKIELDDDFTDKIVAETIKSDYRSLARTTSGYERRCWELKDYEREDMHAHRRHFLALDTLLDWYLTHDEAVKLRAELMIDR